MVRGYREPGVFGRFSLGQLDISSPALYGLRSVELLGEQGELVGGWRQIRLELQGAFELVAGLIVGALEQQRQAEIVGEERIRTV